MWMTRVRRQIILFHNNLNLRTRRKGCERNMSSRANSYTPIFKVPKTCCKRAEFNKRLNQREKSPIKSKSSSWKHGLTFHQSASSTLISSSVQPVAKVFRARNCTQNIATRPSTRSSRSSTMSS